MTNLILPRRRKLLVPSFAAGLAAASPAMGHNGGPPLEPATEAQVSQAVEKAKGAGVLLPWGTLPSDPSLAMFMMAKMSGMLVGGSAPPSAYEVALAAIPNKTFHVRGDTSTASNGVTLSSSPWDNEYGSDVTGSSVWQTGSLNGFRGVSFSSGQSGSSAATLSDILPSDLSFTIFFVASFSGTQGADTNAAYTSCVIRDSLQVFAVGFDSNSRTIAIRSNNQYSTGRTFTDNTPFVCSIKCSSNGANIRIRFNYGSTSTTSGTLGNPSNKSGSLLIGANVAGSGVLYELLFSSDELSDAQMDDFHLLLQQKWALA